ncbi:MAG: hypothetical protein KGZ70_12875 [Hydrogenophaga sp.]|nr:hypothetical protein [Hydrogenophaga sp.]
MGATVFDAARVKTWKTADGRVAYLWEEKTHCIKDGPKHSSWCAMAFGSKADIIRRIYGVASSIPGGMLKVGGRSETAFVDAMLRVLEAPLQLASDKVFLENAHKGFYAAITDENRAAIRRHLQDSGRLDLAHKILDPQSKPMQVEFSLATDFDAIKAIINDVEYDGLDFNDRKSRLKGISVWRAFQHPNTTTGGLGGSAESTLPQAQKPALELRIYRTNINMAYPGSPSEVLAHLATFNGKLIWIGEADGYDLPATVIKVAGDIHSSTGHKVLRPLLREVDAGLKQPLPCSDSASFSFTKDDCQWFAKNLEEVRIKLQKPEGPSMEVSSQELASISRPGFNALRYLLDSSVHRSRLVITGQDEATEREEAQEEQRGASCPELF